MRSGTMSSLHGERKDIQLANSVEQYTNRPLKVSQSVMHMEKFNATPKAAATPRHQYEDLPENPKTEIKNTLPSLNKKNIMSLPRFAHLADNGSPDSRKVSPRSANSRIKVSPT